MSFEVNDGGLEWEGTLQAGSMVVPTMARRIGEGQPSQGAASPFRHNRTRGQIDPVGLREQMKQPCRHTSSTHRQPGTFRGHVDPLARAVWVEERPLTGSDIQSQGAATACWLARAFKDRSQEREGERERVQSVSGWQIASEEGCRREGASSRTRARLTLRATDGRLHTN